MTARVDDKEELETHGPASLSALLLLQPVALVATTPQNIPTPARTRNCIRNANHTAPPV